MQAKAADEEMEDHRQAETGPPAAAATSFAASVDLPLARRPLVHLLSGKCKVSNFDLLLARYSRQRATYYYELIVGGARI